MSRLCACIVSPDSNQDREALIAVAHQFSYLLETIEDGILFDVSGLERLIGTPKQITEKIAAELRKNDLPGSVSVASTRETATLLARQNAAGNTANNTSDTFRQLPLSGLPIERDTLNVLRELSITKIDDLLGLPDEELIGRYGQEFRYILDIIQQNGTALFAPNVKNDRASWDFSLNSPVEDFEQLIFLLNHGLEKLFEQVAHSGHSTEHLDLCFKLRDRSEKAYEIKTSFPTLERAFWLKLINLRVALDPPGSEITAVNVVAHFTRPRPAQSGLYAASRPEPESLLLTVNKLKKLVGDENVGVPTMLDQRLAEAFTLDAALIPKGSERLDANEKAPVIAFSYFRPPVRAEVLVRDKRLVFIKTSRFSGHVTEYSGVWRANSRWWDAAWRTQEWDIEVEGKGVYRLCKTNDGWCLLGEYD